MKSRYRLPLWILLALATFLIVLHTALPHLVRNYLNDRMADMGDYRGYVADVDLAWWRGAYRLDGLLIEKKDKQIQAPLLDAPLIDIAMSWREFWRNQAVVAVVVFEQPKLNFVDGGERGESQTGDGVDWRDQLEALLPITLNEIRVLDGQLSFRNFTAEPPVHVYASTVDASLYNLTNSADAKGERVATFEGTAKMFNQAPVEARAHFDPFTDWENFQISLRMTDLDLTKLNDFSNAYGSFDFAKGSGDLVLEVEANDSQLDGYIKPLLRKVEVFNFRQDIEAEDKGFFRGLWEAMVGGTEEVLQNQRKEQFATRIELSGSTRNADISPFQAFISILRNAFVQAFTARFERSLELEED
ncbi:MAG: DUF748 domain-containing protein [Pseudomonas sp.]